MRRFPQQSRRENQYILVAYHYNENNIDAEAIQNSEASTITNAWKIINERYKIVGIEHKTYVMALWRPRALVTRPATTSAGLPVRDRPVSSMYQSKSVPTWMGISSKADMANTLMKLVAIEHPSMTPERAQ